MLEKYLEDLKKNKNYNLSDMKIEFIKEDEENYLIKFEEKIESIGRSLNYLISKKSGEITELNLPDEKNFDLLDYFENCNFVNIPDKFKDKYF